MSSKRVNQSRNVLVTWLCNSGDTNTHQQAIVVPFAVDEIRIVHVGAQAITLDRLKSAKTVILSSPDLFGAQGVVIAPVRISIKTLNGELDDAPIVSTSDAPYALSATRYVFPPTNKRNVNGSFTFRASEVDGSVINTLTEDFVAVIVLEFIQYEEEDKVRLDSDLMTMSKSGRRRL